MILKPGIDCSGPKLCLLRCRRLYGTVAGPEVPLWSSCEPLAFFYSLGAPTRITHTSLAAQSGLCAEKIIRF